jgi:hypothetical protein
MLYIILYFSLFTSLIVFFIHGLYSYHKSCKAEWEDFLDSLVPGSEWVLQKEPNVNPFNEPSSDTVVIIVETRRNSYGDLWVQYRFKGTEDLYERQADDFQEFCNKLN